MSDFEYPPRMGWCTKHASTTVCDKCEIERLTAELTEAQSDAAYYKNALDTSYQERLKMREQLESAERERDEIKKAYTAVRSHNITITEENAKLESRLARYEEGVEVEGKIVVCDYTGRKQVQIIAPIDSNYKDGQPVIVNVRVRKEWT